ncbi:MAG: rhodanese-like domain-containing protein [Proteobacteria bacterium]|nr:rhodanese-like domain-containing protein [Pseudomonadota bacterium]
MFWKRKTTKDASPIKELTPAQVQEALAQERIVLVDVREPNEHAAEQIKGSLLNALSRFDPSSLPTGDKQVVLYCRSGMRSAKALAQCRAAGLPVNAHMAGGIMAWKRAGLPTVPQQR